MNGYDQNSDVNYMLEVLLCKFKFNKTLLLYL